MSNSNRDQGPEVAGAVTGDHEPDDQNFSFVPEDAPENDQGDKPEAEVETVTLAVENPFYYDSVVLPYGVDKDENPVTLTVARGGTEVPADRADELTEAAAVLGVTLSRS